MVHVCCFQMGGEAVVQCAAAEWCLCEELAVAVQGAVQPAGDGLLEVYSLLHVHAEPLNGAGGIGEGVLQDG